MAGHLHVFRTRLEWEGSTGAGYDHYARAHRLWGVTDAGPLAATVEPDGSLRLSGDAAFRGDASLLNPEQLLVAAASSCHLLSALAVAARRRLDVVAYTDDAVGEMSEADRPMRITTVVLHPHVTLRASADGTVPGADELALVHDKAHHECFIANSVRTDIRVDATFEVIS